MAKVFQYLLLLHPGVHILASICLTNYGNNRSEGSKEILFPELNLSISISFQKMDPLSDDDDDTLMYHCISVAMDHNCTVQRQRFNSRKKINPKSHEFLVQKLNNLENSNTFKKSNVKVGLSLHRSHV